MEALFNELGRAIEGLSDVLAGKRTPDRFDIRALSLPLGRLITEEQLANLPSDLKSALESLHSSALASPDQWGTAFHEELAFAADEFCQSVDPRYLDLPNYDLDYTMRSRRALGYRLEAAQHLRIPTPDGLEARIAESDSQLAPYLAPGKGGQPKL